jgi:hypothetical protein
MTTVINWILATVALVVVVPYWWSHSVAPNQPLAVDGSLAAGRNRTFVDENPDIYAPPPLSQRQPGDPREQAFRDKIDGDLRDRARKWALDQLRRPGPGLCNEPGRTPFINGVSGYYAARDSQQHNYAVRTPAEQAQVERAWSTALDQQIDGLVREFFVAGYLRRQDLRKSPIVDEVLSGAVSTGHACGDRS